MSTIGSLMLALGQGGPSPYGDIQRQTAGTRGLELGNETALLKLADLKRSQASEQEVMAAIQRDPALAKLFFGDSMMGQLGTAPGGAPPGGPPAPGPMTQQTVMPGQPPGPPQVVPGGQDLSQFATQGAPQQNPRGFAPEGGGPQQSVLGSLGPQGGMPGQGQAPRNPVMEMAARDPRAAMMLQQQIQGQQDRQMTMQTQRLKIGSAMMSSLGQMAQGVTDQAGWDQLRQDATQIDPQLAARLPQVYSKEVRDRVVTQALDVKEAMTLQVQDLQAQAALLKARKEGRSTDVDNHLRAMGVQPGQETPEQMRQALKDVQEGKVAVSGAQGVEAARIERTEKPLEAVAAKSVSDLTLLRTMSDDIAALRHDDYTGPIVGRTGYLREQAGQMKEQEVAFRRTVKDVQDILGRLRSGAAIPAPEMSRLEGLAPSVNDPPAVFQSKLQSFQRALEQNRDSILRVGTTGREQLRQQTTPTTPLVGQQPQGQAQPAATATTFNDADIAATMADPRNKGKTRQQIIDGLLAAELRYQP